MITVAESKFVSERALTYLNPNKTANSKIFVTKKVNKLIIDYYMIYIETLRNNRSRWPFFHIDHLMSIILLHIQLPYGQYFDVSLRTSIEPIEAMCR